MAEVMVSACADRTLRSLNGQTNSCPPHNNEDKQQSLEAMVTDDMENEIIQINSSDKRNGASTEIHLVEKPILYTSRRKISINIPIVKKIPTAKFMLWLPI